MRLGIDVLCMEGVTGSCDMRKALCFTRSLPGVTPVRLLYDDFHGWGCAA